MDEKEKRLFYIPGDLTPAKYLDYSRELLLEKYLSPKYEERKRVGFPTLADGYSKDPDKKSIYQYNPYEEMSSEEIRRMWNEKCVCSSKDTPNENDSVCCSKPNKQIEKPKRGFSSKIKRIPSTVVSAMKNFDLAKRLHRENLQHHPLPEVITDAMYQKLQYQRAKEPGLALKDEKFASAVAWKEHGGYAPTRCSKLKIYRPKTGIENRVIENMNERPCSVSSFDKRWRFIRKSKVTPIDLAICWDLLPVNPLDEPKPGTHIDGSNGSSAPAVFQLVNNPQNFCNLHSPIKENKFCVNRPQTAFVPTRKIAVDEPRIHSAYYEREERRYRSCPCLMNKYENEKYAENVKYSNACYRTRRCGACELKSFDEKKKKGSEYKMAFKAGVPNNQRQDVAQLIDARNNYKPSKCPITPYKSRKYTIDTLNHPFAFQKTLRRRDYPEHWRLATIYQQSYKHPELRKY